MTNPIGTWFETKCVDYLRRALDRPVIERLPRKGKNDTGDIGHVRALGLPIVVEAKCVRKLNLAGWVKEAEVERQNAIREAEQHGARGPIAAVVIHKRAGKGQGNMGEQYVTMTLDDFIAILHGRRP